MRDVAVIGVGMTPFGKFLEKGIKDLVRESAEEALRDAGLEKKDIQAAGWIEEGHLEIDGRMPSNPSGGLVTKGHPVGATGCAQIYEIVKQPRGEAGPRQVKDPRVGMTHNGGGILGIDASSMTLHVFKR